MTDLVKTDFDGFSQKTIDFLSNLRENNNKQWFEAHRTEYEEHLISPMKLLVEELASTILSIDPYLDVRPMVNKAVSRIHRDLRFSKNKSPYKTVMWIAFKHNRTDWKDTPGFFFEFCPERYRYGMGLYQASRQTMDAYRELLDSKPDAFLKVISLLEKYGFELQGEKYKRIIDPSKTGVILDWYQRKSFYVVCSKSMDRNFFSPELAGVLSGAFMSLKPLYDFFWKAKG